MAVHHGTPVSAMLGSGIGAAVASTREQSQSTKR
jgi:hypothetical protein